MWGPTPPCSARAARRRRVTCGDHAGAMGMHRGPAPARGCPSLARPPRSRAGGARYRARPSRAAGHCGGNGRSMRGKLLFMAAAGSRQISLDPPGLDKKPADVQAADEAPGWKLIEEHGFLVLTGDIPAAAIPDHRD